VAKQRVATDADAPSRDFAGGLGWRKSIANHWNLAAKTRSRERATEHGQLVSLRVKATAHEKSTRPEPDARLVRFFFTRPWPNLWGRGNDEDFFGEEANPLKRITF
jgi:hypothetical protein